MKPGGAVLAADKAIRQVMPTLDPEFSLQLAQASSDAIISFLIEQGAAR